MSEETIQTSEAPADQPASTDTPRPEWQIAETDAHQRQFEEEQTARLEDIEKPPRAPPLAA
jgi:hypothetical protein